MQATISLRRRVPIALLTLSAFGLRLVQLGHNSLWYDETVSVYLAGQPAAELIAHTARDIHPPLYYLLLRGWLLLSGYPTGHADPDGFRLEFMAAWLSLIFGVLLVPLTWQWARRLGLGERAAASAALLLAVSPLGVWYSQEVRMYTLGAALGVGLMLAAQPFLQTGSTPRRLRRAAVLVALLGAAGMYTLYYFVFLLVSLNLLVLALWLSRGFDTAAPAVQSAQPTTSTARSGFGALVSAVRPAQPAAFAPLWLASQLGLVLFYLPWLPTAWRQAINPPVPPWRTAPQLVPSLTEGWTALTFGQSVEAARVWPLLLLALLLVLLGLLRTRRRVALTLLAAGLGPPLLILLASLWTPLYHVRYLAIYAPAWSILPALGLAALSHGRGPQRVALPAALLLLLLGNVLSLRAFWHDPALHADDLRGAVHELAARWRPGDVILVNAGYTYPALLTYWPWPVSWHGRLSDYTQAIAALAGNDNGAVIVQSGHLDGDPRLGWGDPRSDFYALPAAAAHTALRDLSAAADRLWQFRLYDTVNDPQGMLRQDLRGLWTLFDDRVYAGEANLRVQGWLGMHPLLSSYLPPTVATFDNWLTLALPPDAAPDQLEAGSLLSASQVQWSRGASQPIKPVMLSLRLADPTGEVWAAQDEPLGGNQLDLRTAGQLAQPLGLPIPLGVAPGKYDWVLVVYDPATGKPMSATLPDGSAAEQVTLAQVQVTSPAQPPALQPAVADFGALRLISASTPATMLSAGDSAPLALTWQAAAGYTPQPLVVVVQALDAAGNVVASLEEEPLHGRFPTAQWQPRELVNDRHTLQLPASLPPGEYRIVVGVYDAVDRQRLTLRRGLFGSRDGISFVAGTVTIRNMP